MRMRRLIIFEFRKIMIPRVWISIAGSLLIAFFYFVSFYPSGTNSLLVVNKERPEVIATHSGPIQPDLALKYAPRLKEEYAEDSVGSKAEKMTRILEQRYAASAYSLDLFNKNLTELREQKALLEKQDQGSYVLKDVTKRLSMLEGIQPPGFYVTNDWGSLYRFFSIPGVGNMLIGLILVFALAPLYSGEANYRMDSLILSSKYGRLKIVTAKLLAGSIVTVSFVTLFYGVCVLFSCLPFGFVGWNAPLNSYFAGSPYDLTQLQGVLLKYAVTLLAACGLLLLTALISALFRSSISTLGLAICLVLLPNFSLPGVVGEWIDFLPSGVIMSTSLIEKYVSYNIFGTPILYLPLSIFSVIITGVIAMLFLPKAFERRLKG
jgi:ABC-type transport system involved in multi-copper enzyme maturation permease subunit